MNARRGLGRGLGALIPPAPAEEATRATRTTGSPGDQPSGDQTPPLVAGAYFAEVPVRSIAPNPRQPRQVFDEEAMAELVHSIREIGLLQPIVVRELGPGSGPATGIEDGAGTDAARFELVMGERRWRAATTAGLEKIPAIVRRTSDDAMLRDALLENLHRSQLNPLEEAAAYGQLLDDFGCTHDDLAQRIGRSRPQITNTLRLLKLPAGVQRRLAAGVLSAGHARALLTLPDDEARERMAQRVVAEGWSVRTLEETVAVGENPERPSRGARGPKPVAPKLVELEGRLADRFETRVKVALGRSKGKITVEFASIDDLERIVGLMDPASESPGSQDSSVTDPSTSEPAVRAEA